MPIQKFRTFQAARRALWSNSLDTPYLQRLRGLWALSSRIHPLSFPAGVFKYRGVEEADRDRQRWLEKRVQEIRQKRARERNM